MTEFLQWTAGAGFAIAVAAFILVRLEPAVKQLSESIAKLSGVIGKCQKQ